MRLLVVVVCLGLKVKILTLNPIGFVKRKVLYRKTVEHFSEK